MGAVCAVVYLLTVIIFIPFPFYKDIVAATSGGGNREIVFERHQMENGRVLRRFPHSKVRHSQCALEFREKLTAITQAGLVSFGHSFPAVGRPSRHWRRFIRHSMAT